MTALFIATWYVPIKMNLKLHIRHKTSFQSSLDDHELTDISYCINVNEDFKKYKDYCWNIDEMIWSFDGRCLAHANTRSAPMPSSAIAEPVSRAGRTKKNGLAA
jgi:hypothetical protein